MRAAGVLSRPLPESDPVNPFAPGPRRAAAVACFLATLALLLYFGLKGAREIREVNDFEVYYMASRLAAERSPSLYTARSPEKDRPFLYPAAGAVLLAPLSHLSESAAGMVFSVLKVSLLGAFLLGCLNFSGARPRSPAHFWAAALLSLAVVFRPLNNDFGNGQMNLIAASITIGGVWLLMSAKPKGWLGILLVAAGVCLKPPPGLLLLVPLLARRLARFSAASLFLVLVALGLPVLWYGPGTAAALRHQFNTEAPILMMEAKTAEDQIALVELVVFTIAQARAPENLRWVDKDLLLAGPDGRDLEIELPDPFSPRTASLLWLALAVSTLSSWLAARGWAFGGRERDWSWDLASLCVLVILLSPVARKAHLIIVLPAVAWLVCHMLAAADRAGSWRSWLRAHRALAPLSFGATLLLYISDDLAIPGPGFPIPYHPAPLLAMMTLLVLLCAAARAERNSGPEGPHATPSA